jgi:hypothetical protein
MFVAVRLTRLVNAVKKFVGDASHPNQGATDSQPLVVRRLWRYGLHPNHWDGARRNADLLAGLGATSVPGPPDAVWSAVPAPGETAVTPTGGG